jgi:hypothetical protein
MFVAKEAVEDDAFLKRTIEVEVEAVEVADEVVDAAPASTSIALLSPLRAIQAGLDELKAESERATWDVDTTDGEKAAREFRQRCVKIRTSADAAYEQGNKPLLEVQRQGRELRDAIKAFVEPIELAWGVKIKAKEDRKAREKAEREQAERVRLAAIRKRIEAITSSPVHAAAAKTAADIAFVMRGVNELQINEELFGEFIDEATGARDRVLITLTQLHETAVARELEVQRLEEQRQELARQQAELDRKAAEQREELERQQREAKELADKLEAQRLEQQRKDEAERAEQQRKDEAARAELKRQQDAFEEERRQAREAIEAEKLRAAAEREAELEALTPLVLTPLAISLNGEPDAGARDDSLVVDVEFTPNAATASGDQAPAFELTPDEPTEPSRPTDTEILHAICYAFQIDERQALDWIEAFNVAAETRRIKESA